MFEYTMNAILSLFPRSGFNANITEQLDLSWNYDECSMRWFRVEGQCFSPPATSTCPPFPQDAETQQSCQRIPFTIASLYNTGVDDSDDALSPGDTDFHWLTLPATRPEVVINLPGYAQPPDENSEWIGFESESPTQQTYRIAFDIPTNVDATTVEITFELCAINAVYNIILNDVDTGLSAIPDDVPDGTGITDVQFVLTNFKPSNTLDFVVGNSGPGVRLAALKLKFTNVEGCVGTGGRPTTNDCIITYNINVRACDAEDVCRILKNRNFVFPIKVISEINDSLDANCYVNVTPNVQNCTECCEFLIDEDIVETIGADMYYLAQEYYAGSISLYLSSGATYRQIYTYQSRARLILSSDTTISADFIYMMNGILNLSSGSVVSSSFHDYTMTAGLVLSSGTIFGSSSYGYTTNARLMLSSDSQDSSVFYYRGNGLLNLLSGFEPIFNYRITGILRIGSRSTYGISSIQLPMNALLVLGSRTVFSSTNYHYFTRGFLRLRSKTQLILPYEMNALVRINSLTQSRPAIDHRMNARLILSADSVIVSSAFSYTGNILLNLSSQSEWDSTDWGQMDTEASGFASITNEGVSFASTVLPALSTVIPNRSDTGCCNPVMPIRLEVRHNLQVIQTFSQFLLRNNLTIPGNFVNFKSIDFIPIYYNARTGSYSGNVHLSGLSPILQSTEIWDISFEFGCNGEANASPNTWRFAVLLSMKNLSFDSKLRIVGGYSKETVCPQTVLFQSFAVAIDANNLVSNPSAELGLSINDEQGILSADKILLFSVSAATTGSSRQTFPVSLAKQLNASLLI